MADSTTPPPLRRAAGLTVPLFSIRTERSWGIGEITDLPDLGDWLTTAGISLVQLLPLGELSSGETSPYAALSAFGIDPVYIGWSHVEDLSTSVLPLALGDDGTQTLSGIRRSDRVDYRRVRAVKSRALIAAWRSFRAQHLDAGTERAKAFRHFCREHSDWLAPYALFRTLRDVFAGQPWWHWPAPFRDRTARALEHAWAAHGDRVRRYQYAQWIAHTQWFEAREKLRRMGVELMGDLPFMVGRDSADLWAHRGEFKPDASVGAPPDQFNDEGQDWGLPPYDWDAIRSSGYRWLQRRARYAGWLYDRFRIDHLVGFFRTFQRPTAKLRGADGKLSPGHFDPETIEAQKANGEAAVTAMRDAAREHGADLVAEDLGDIPNYVRPALQALNVPGYKVLVWERDGGKYRDPREFPARSVACFGTHDTAPVSVWWRGLQPWERDAVAALPAMRERDHGAGWSDRFTPEAHSALVDLLLGSRSELVLLLMQDLLGVDDRVNVPSTVNAQNWTWCLSKTIDQLRTDPSVQALMAMVSAAVTTHDRRPALDGETNTTNTTNTGQ